MDLLVPVHSFAIIALYNSPSVERKKRRKTMIFVLYIIMFCLMLYHCTECSILIGQKTVYDLNMITDIYVLICDYFCSDD